MRARRPLAVLLLGGLAAFVALSAAAMARYPGGTWWDSARQGHAFWANFFCDLTQPSRLDGHGPNPAAPLARAAMLALAVALLPFWLLLPLAFPDHPRLGRTTRGLGALSALVSLAVPLTPSLLFPKLHSASSLATGGLGVLAAGAAFVGMWRARAPPIGQLVCATVGIGAGVLNGGLYVAHLAGLALSPLTPVAQKIAALALVAWMGLVASVGWKRP